MNMKKFSPVVLAMLAAVSSLSAHADYSTIVNSDSKPRPYVFGSIGAAQDGLKTDDGVFNDRDAKVAGQVGAGLQLNQYLGGELYYQSGAKHKYNGANGASDKVLAQTLGARATLGTSVNEKARVFAKAGVAATNHDSNAHYDYNNRAAFTAGVGASYNVTDNFAVRTDYDHSFKRNSDIDRKGSDYVGVGGQFTF